MPKTLEDVRNIVQRETGLTEWESIVNWCNDLHMDVGAVLNVPAPTYQIVLNTTDLDYPLPDDLKEINRFWSQRDYDSGVQKDIEFQYRIYNGRLQLPLAWPVIDTLNMDYYKFLRFFESQTDPIDFPDRYLTLYTAYCKMRYYELPSTIQLIGDVAARQNYEREAAMYQNMRNQVIQNYSYTNPDLVIKERW